MEMSLALFGGGRRAIGLRREQVAAIRPQRSGLGDQAAVAGRGAGEPGGG